MRFEDFTVLNIATSKNSITHDLFVRTADENYITARWCAVNGLNTDFLWLATHALEKYLKAVLLINGKSSKGYNHDIVKLYEKVKKIGGTLLPKKLSQPVNLDISNWRDRSADDFIEQLCRNGNPHNRYLIFGYTTEREDIFMLDAMVFAIRRLICPLDDFVFFGPHSPKFTHREELNRQPEYFGRMGMPLDKLISARKDSDTRTAALNLNMAFAPKNFPHTPMRNGFSARNPAIVRRVLKPLDSDNAASAAEGVEIARWLVSNVKLDRDVEGQIETAINDACAKHNIS